MPDSDKFQTTVRLQNWAEDDFPLLCGIANAGGGRVLVSSKSGSHARKMKRFRKSFETIPRLTRQELGIDCTTEPLVDGTDLCLEIQVPAAPSPLQFRGTYYLYSEGINTVVTEELLRRLFFTSENEARGEVDVAPDDAHRQAKPAPEDGSAPDNDPALHNERAEALAKLSVLDSDGRPTFKDRSIAAANRLDLTSTDEYVLKVLRTNGRATAPRIADVLVVSESTVRRSFRKLREYGLIERIGSRKAGYWRIVD